MSFGNVFFIVYIVYNSHACYSVFKDLISLRFPSTTLKLTTSTDHSTFYFSDFVTEFYKIMLRLIDRNSKRVATSELSVLKYELQCHLWIMKAGLLFFNFNPTWNFLSLINPTRLKCRLFCLQFFLSSALRTRT